MSGQPRERTAIQCLDCGKWFRALPVHLMRGHGIDVDDYRLRHGIPISVPLVCVEWSENQVEKNVERDARQTLTARGPRPGFKRKPSVLATQKAKSLRLAAMGTAAALQIDKTAERRQKLAPYPVTPDQAAVRLGCTASAAYTFLSYCVAQGKLRRSGRGLYDEALPPPIRPSPPTPSGSAVPAPQGGSVYITQHVPRVA